MIRRATADDAAAIAAVQHRAWAHAYADLLAPEDLGDVDDAAIAWRELLEEGSTLVAEAGGRVAGFASAGVSRDEDTPPRTGELYALYVDPPAQGAGLGTTLLEAAAGDLRGRSFERAVLWVLEANGLARAFYERHGWAPEGAPREHRWGPEVRYRRDL